MNSPADRVVSLELPIIAKIIQDEVWLEGERRGCAVSPDDPIVRENVCAVILRVGRELREQLEAGLVRSAGPGAADTQQREAA